MHWTSPESRSRSLYERARKIFPGANTRQQIWMSPYPPYLASGRGLWVTDVDGHRYLDLTGNLGVLIHGHAHPLVNAAIAEQLEHGTCFALPTEAELRLGGLLCGRVPGFERLRFTNTGSEAVAVALRAARAFNGRSRIARIEGVYHGSDDLAAVGTDSSPDNWGTDPASTPRYPGMPAAILDQVLVLPANDLEATERLLAKAGDTLAAILVDPAPLRCGFTPLDSDYMALLRDLSRRAGTLLIFDEVIAFRLGFSGAQGRFGIDPDLTALGKIIGGGMPIGAVAGREDVMAVFGNELEAARVPASGTFTANPVSMVAGDAAMSLLDSAAFEHLEHLGHAVRERAASIILAAGVPAQITGIGSLFCLHPHDRQIRDYRDYHRSREEVAIMGRIHRSLLEQRVLLTPNGSGFLATVMREQDLEAFFTALPAALATAFA
ncbi:MAG: aminotransferase class III-fold pyridoxal phosphate-dependent enzyme [Gammaproteobacteria bacterium]|nr:aminotransferase class III-fold pyridoxal phosphate-dependent enzyme [Gammaproteobacteria bacterium]